MRVVRNQRVQFERHFFKVQGTSTTGRMSASVVDDHFGLMIFGACGAP
jgi:hypothetical protein